jgi:hypothetical protein
MRISRGPAVGRQVTQRLRGWRDCRFSAEDLDDFVAAGMAERTDR